MFSIGPVDCSAVAEVWQNRPNGRQVVHITRLLGHVSMAT